jgi:hypothetical protein
MTRVSEHHIPTTLAPPASAPDPVIELSAGMRVEVRRRFDQHWARGFEVAEQGTQGFRLRRLSDGEVLPVEFRGEDLRKERKQSNFGMP